MSPTRKALVNFLSTLDVSGRVLDIGGTVWSVQKKTKTWKVSEYKTLAEDEGDYALDLNVTVSQTVPYGHFDVIFCMEVMQFIYDTGRVMENINWCLKKGGRAFFSFHLTHPKMKSHDYLRYTKEGAIKLLTENGFVSENTIEPIAGYYIIQSCKKDFPLL